MSARRFLSPGIRRFLRYSAVGISITTFDLALLYVLTDLLDVPYYLGTPLAFLFATSLMYALVRLHVFKGSERPVPHGYAYYLGIALIGAAITTGGVALLVSSLEVHYLIARILIAGFVGMGNYLTNLYFNFRVVGYHP